MANSSRLDLDREGNMFIPMNIEASEWSDHFITTPKMLTIVAIVGSAVIAGLYLSSCEAGFGSYVLMYLIWLIISVTCLRYIVFEEKFYYRMYKEMQTNKITTPGAFWGLAAVEDTESGAILTYSNGTIGVIVKPNRDTIIGKPSDFAENHIDAVSEFYRKLSAEGYSFIPMNLMETAGSDPRLPELDKLIGKCDNENLRKLIELEVGHIKNITHATLYESEYILVYTANSAKIDIIMSDVMDAAYYLMDGAYNTYSILDRKEIADFARERFGVKYFDMSEAIMNVFSGTGARIKNPFDIVGVVWSTGDEQDFDNKERIKVRNMTSEIVNGTKEVDSISFKEALFSDKNKNNFGIKFDDLSKGLSDESIKKPQQTRARGRVNTGKGVKSKSDFGKMQFDFNLDESDLGFPDDSTEELTGLNGGEDIMKSNINTSGTPESDSDSDDEEYLDL